MVAGANVLFCPLVRLLRLKLRDFATICHAKEFSNVPQDVNSLQSEYSSPEAKAIARKGFVVTPNFVSKTEEQALLQEIDTKWGRLRYQQGHWDNAIQNYREIEISSWSEANLDVLERIKSQAFAPNQAVRNIIHILDLAEDGFIKPHVDSVKFCGDSIAGLSLLSSSVMKFVDESNPESWFKLLLPARSLYVMKDSVRYKFTHEIMKTEDSFINQQHVPKTRRISILTRTVPDAAEDDPKSIFKTIPIPLDEVS